jgi:hypothetical protein
MNRAVFLLRLSYWIAAIADFTIAILFLMPERMGVPNVVYPMGLASVVAFSWSVILVMADRKPLERRWILIPTTLVVALIAVIRTLFSLDGTIVFSWVLLGFPVVLIILMMYSYYNASKYVTNS